jgi:hypothetical protein
MSGPARHPLEIVDRHLLVRLDGGLALVDTGSPFDIGRGRASTLLGHPWAPSAEHDGVLEAASTHLGVGVEWVLGEPTLRRLHLVLDWTARTAVFSRARPRLAGGAALALDVSGPVPTVEIRVSGAPVRAILDSGAALSYAPSPAVAGRRPVRAERDFHPILGPFDTEVYAIPIVVGARSIAMEAGVLPERLAGTLAVGSGWILGSDFFRDRAIGLSYPDAEVVDAPGASLR